MPGHFSFVVLLGLLAILLLPSPLWAASQPEAQIPSWFKLSFLDLPEDIAEAAQQDKRLMLFFYQDGCPACAVYYREIFVDEGVKRRLQRHFDVIAIEIGGNRELIGLDGEPLYEKAFVAKHRAAVTPTVFFLDESAAIKQKLYGRVTLKEFESVLDKAIED